MVQNNCLFFVQHNVPFVLYLEHSMEFSAQFKISFLIKYNQRRFYVFLNYCIICFIFQVNPRYHNQSYINGDRWSSTNTSEFPPINRPRLVKIVSFWLVLLLVGLICAIIYLAHIRGKHLNFKQNLKVV